MANKFNFKPLERKARGAMESALILIGNEAKNHFVDNFKKQGFDDKQVKAWAPRKQEDNRKGRAILVDSGDLRRSIIRGLINKSNLSVKIKTDLKYAKVHNDGGIIYRTAHKRTSTRTAYINGGYSGLGSEKIKGKKMKVIGERHNVSASSFKMPKRQFIGDSYNLNEKVKKVIVAKLDSVFK